MKYIKQTLLLIVVSSLVVFLYSCGGTGQSLSSSTPHTSPIGDGLAREQAASADETLKEPVVALTNVLLADGSSVDQVLTQFGVRSSSPQSPNEFKRLFIAKMIAEGHDILSYSTFTGTPSQTKLAYVYGSKDYKSRKRPSAGCCVAALYGLDCSGLVYHCAISAGISLVSGPASSQGAASSWGIPPSWRVTMKDVSVSVNASGDYQTGDILYWSTGHIGIVEGNGVIQSNGTPGCTSAGCTAATSCEDTGECSKNAGATRGPSIVAISSIKKWPGFGNPISVLRIDTGQNLDGTWTGTQTLPAFGGCQTTSGDVTFTFTDKNGADGGPITASFRSTVSPGSGSYPFTFSGSRTKNSYTITDTNHGLEYHGTLIVDATAAGLDTITVTAPYFCGSSPSTATYSLKRNESGSRTRVSIPHAVDETCPSCLTNSRK